MIAPVWQIESLVHEIVSLDELIEQMLYGLKPVRDNDMAPDGSSLRRIQLRVPLPLACSYLKLFEDAWLVTARVAKEVEMHYRLSALIATLGDLLSSFVDVRLFGVIERVRGGEQLEDESASHFQEDTSLIVDFLLPVLQALFGSHYSEALWGEAAVMRSRQIAAAVARLAESLSAAENQQLAADYLDIEAINRCLHVLASRRLLNGDGSSRLKSGGALDLDARSDSCSLSSRDEPTDELYDSMPPPAADLLNDKTPERTGVVSLASIESTMLANVAGSGKPTAAGALPTAERMPQEHLRDFINAYADIEEADKEFDGLVDIFWPHNAKHHHHHHGHHQHAGSPRAHDQKECVRCLSNLISTLLGGRLKHGERMDKLTLQRTSALLRVLVSILERSDPHDDERSRVDHQERLEAHTSLQSLLGGAPPVGLHAARIALMMISCDVDGLCGMGLELGIALLRGGNLEVQKAMFELLSVPKILSEIGAFDGTDTPLLHMLKMRIRKAISEIREEKFYLESQRERRATFEEDTAGLSAATVDAMKAELEQPFASRSFVLLTLQFLQLLCEGHNNELQDLLSSDEGADHTVDLVSEVYELLFALEPEMDATNLPQVELCVAALTEFLQGNVSMRNSRKLLDTKLLEVLDRLVHKKLESIAGVDISTLCELRCSVTTLLMALLEGTDRSVETRMCAILDLSELSSAASDLYKEAAEAKGRGESSLEEKLLDAGFSLYILIRHLLDFHEQTSTSSEGLGLAKLDEDVEEYYSNQVGVVEIMNQLGELERVHFRFPAFCQLLTMHAPWNQKLLFGDFGAPMMHASWL